MIEITDLNGEWELHPVSEFSNLWLGEQAPAEGWIKQEIPAHWQEHPALQKHCGKMIYRKFFTFKPEKDHIYRLETGGVFYRFRVYLNKFALGGAEGYYVPASFNLTPYLREKNCLVLEVDSPGHGDPALLTGFFSRGPGLPPGYNPGGIWQPVRIVSSGPACLCHWNLRTEAVQGDKGLFFLEGRVFSSREAVVELDISFNPHNFTGASLSRKFTISLQPGMNNFQYRFEMEGVKPWWTWDLGEPNLYQTHLRLQSAGVNWDEKADLFGVRTFAMQGFIPYLNGKRFFIKGSNYLPPALYPGRIDKERYCEDFSLIKKANQNMVRCYRHAGVPDFYRAAAEAGVLVWQDFPLNITYPVAQRAGAFQQIWEFARTLGRYPAVAAWSILNVSGFEGGKREKPGYNLRLLANKLAKRLRELDPSRPVIAVSGRSSLFSPSDTGFACGVWPEEGDLYRFDRYRRGMAARRIRFVSWFGAPDPAQERAKPPAKGEKEDERKVPREMVSQEQSEVLRFYIDRLRYHKYNPTGGMLVYCFRDLVPGLSWSVVEDGGTPKESFDTLALCYRPVYVFALFQKPFYHVRELLNVPVCFSNDRRDPVLSPVRVKARFTDPRDRLVWKDQWNVTPSVDEKTRILGNISVMLMERGEYKLELFWEDGEEVMNIYRVKVL